MALEKIYPKIYKIDFLAISAKAYEWKVLKSPDAKIKP
jgi:hypothetical protein